MALNNMLFIGIDPGFQGAIATISEQGIEAFKMPLLASGKKKTYSHHHLRQFFAQLDESLCYAILEAQHAMPKQGVVSMMSIGYGFGALKQCLVDFAISHEVVRANIWQKEFGISSRKGNTKVQALQICRDLFPDANLLATEKSKKAHEGIIDAVLIAEFARRRYGGNNEK